MHKEIPPDLIKQFRDGKVIVVAGTGVTMASVGDDQQTVTSWIKLVKNGLEKCRGIPKSSQQQIDLHIASLNSSDNELGKLFDAANYVVRILENASPPQYVQWLDEAFKDLKVVKPELIKSIGSLNCPIWTLNYDSLMHKTLSYKTATWKSPYIAQAIAQGDLKQRVFHLHGHFADAKSVILSDNHYATLSAKDAIQGILQSVATLKTFLFVGCGMTVKDPTWQPLLIRMEAIYSSSGEKSLYRHYFLVLDSKTDDFRDMPSSIIVTPYGDSHDDLPLFLEELATHSPTSKKN